MDEKWWSVYNDVWTMVDLRGRVIDDGWTRNDDIFFLLRVTFVFISLFLLYLAFLILSICGFVYLVFA